MTIARCCRYKLEHNQISRSEVDKSDVFEILNLHLLDPDSEIQHTALQLIQVNRNNISNIPTTLNFKLCVFMKCFLIASTSLCNNSFTFKPGIFPQSYLTIVGLIFHYWAQFGLGSVQVSYKQFSPNSRPLYLHGKLFIEIWGGFLWDLSGNVFLMSAW